jgi:hypothetical protein
MKKIDRNLLTGLFLFFACVLCACSPVQSSPTPAATMAASPTAVPTVQSTATQATPSILSALPNAKYPIDVTSSGSAQLKDGMFEEPAAPGSASKITVSLGKNQAEGDLNGDGSADAAVTLIAETGGSGTFTYLAAVLNNKGLAEPLNSISLGDRIIVKSLTIQAGQIEVDFLDHATNEPMASAPTMEVVKKFKLQDNQLVEMK